MSTARSRAAKFDIHNDLGSEQEMDMDESQVEEEEQEQEEAYSDCSDATDEIVDATVAEDMIKFEDTFKGIKDRFRLINRIGEGM